MITYYVVAAIFAALSAPLWWYIFKNDSSENYSIAPFAMLALALDSIAIFTLLVGFGIKLLS